MSSSEQKSSSFSISYFPELVAIEINCEKNYPVEFVV